MAHSAISGAVMFGRGKHGCGVLLELRPTHDFDPKDTKVLVEFRNTIWCASLFHFVHVRGH